MRRPLRVWGAERKPVSRCGVVTLCLALLLGCGGSGATGGSADASVADASAPALDGGLLDALADAPRRAALWTRIIGIRPHCLAAMLCDPDPCYPASAQMAPTIISATTAPGGLELRGGRGVPVDADAGIYLLEETWAPTSVFAATEPVVLWNGGTYTPFATVSEFAFRWTLSGGSAALPLERARLEGTLDPDGFPTSLAPSADPSTPLVPAGRFEGCLPGESAGEIYIEVLGQTWRQYLNSSGCQLDCASTAEGGLDGYLFELRWEAAEVVTLVEL